MRGARQRGFSLLMRRMRSRTSGGTGGRPGLHLRIFHVQNSRNAFRCQALTVSGLTIIRPTPVCPHAGQPNPQQSVGCVQARAFLRRTFQHADLMPERNILQLHSRAGFRTDAVPATKNASNPEIEVRTRMRCNVHDLSDFEVSERDRPCRLSMPVDCYGRLAVHPDGYQIAISFYGTATEIWVLESVSLFTT